MRWLLALLFTICISTRSAYAQPDTDGIPTNCENSVSSYVDANLVIRYSNGTLALVNWSSGDVARIIEQIPDMPELSLVGWSPNCRHLVGGLLIGERYTTVIWDAINGGRVGTIEDGLNQPHFLYWSPRSDAVVVETRHGAFLWDLPSNQRYSLTAEADAWAGRSFRDVVWDYETGTLNTFDRRGRWTSSSFTTDRVAQQSNVTQLDLTNNGAQELRCISFTQPLGGNGRIPGFEIRYYPGTQQLVLYDVTTDNVAVILDTNYAQGLRVSFWARGQLSPGCTMFAGILRVEGVPNGREVVVIRLSDSTRIHTIERFAKNTSDHRLIRLQWDPTGRYLFAQTYDGALIWDSVANTTFYLTSSEEINNLGFSVKGISWDAARRSITIVLRLTNEQRTFDLATGQRLE